jgi:flagellar M-ring protein FliF
VEFLRQLYRGIAEAWQQLSLSARTNIILAAAAVTVVIGVVVFMGVKPQYVTLSRDLDAPEVTRIREALLQENMDFKITDNNRTIQVKAEDLSNAQLLLAQNDLPVGRRSLPGFELFQKSELMTNQWLQDVKFMRAVQGELQRQLNAFDFVTQSHVLIREAEEEFFSEYQRPSEASVTLDISRPLTKKEVKALVSIISHAGGPNLDQNNITVTTTTGEVLWLPPSSPFAALANSRLELRVEEEQQREQRLMRKLKEMGVRGTVSVSAKMNFDKKKVMEHETSEGTELSEYETTTSLESTEQLPEGAPGALANVPEGTASAGGVRTTEENSENIVNYEPSFTTTETTTDPGNVVKYIVAMIVEGNYEESEDEDGNTVREYAGLTETQRQAYIDLAKAAVGEGETETAVTIHDQPFELGQLDSASQIAAAQAAEQREWWLRMVWNIGYIVSIIAGFFLIRLFLHRAIEIPPDEEEAEETVPEVSEAMAEQQRREEVANEIRRIAANQPEVVASLLRTWMSEEED